jgi:hypothetical protein
VSVRFDTEAGPGKLDAEDVRARLRVADVLNRFGVQYRDRAQIRLSTCPLCGKRQRRAAFLVDRETGDCIHHSGPDASGAPCKSDIFGLTAALAGINVRTEFPRVLELAAEIAGIAPDHDPAELARARAEYRTRVEASARQAAVERAAAEERVPELWLERERRHLRGERYLADRGLDPAALRACGDVVRYRIADGAPSVQLHDLETGAPINILTRQLDREPKVISLDIRRTLGCHDVRGSHSTVGTLGGRIGDLDTAGEGADVAILVEGVADTLAALLAFPGCVVLGASGWHHMEAIAAAVTPRVVQARGWLLVGVHDDEQGKCGAVRAMHAAIAAGLVLDESIDTIDIGAHKDLADAWRVGWRWEWPERLGFGPGGAS